MRENNYNKKWTNISGHDISRVHIPDNIFNVGATELPNLILRVEPSYAFADGALINFCVKYIYC